MAENALIATQDLTVCGDTIHRSVAAVDVRHLPQRTGSAAVSSRVRRPAALCVVLYYGSSLDAAGGRGSVEKINSRWRRLPRV